MDILSHGLWPAGIYKVYNLRKKSSFRVKLAFVFGILPDILAFAPAFILIWIRIIFRDETLADLPRSDDFEPANPERIPYSTLTSVLYNFSHSMFIFFLIFGISFFIFRRPIWEMGAWLMHILMDIPTHSYEFFPTPFLWPISEWKFDGFAWGVPWFVITNYSLLIVFYLILYIIGRNKKVKELKLAK